MKLLDWLVTYGLVESKSKARQLLKQKAIRVCDSQYHEKAIITDPNYDMGNLKGIKI